VNSRPIKVAVVFGGRSNEHSVSCVSAGSVMRYLDPNKYDVVPVGITQGGTWVVGTSDPAELTIRDRALPSVRSSSPIALSVDPERAGSISVIDEGAAVTLLSTVDVVFPVLHGAFGEDGTVQGLLEVAGIPYVGAGVLASAASMDKEFTKKLLAAEGLPVGTQVVLRAGTDTVSPADRDRLGLPAFVKPARGGSSIGITRITSWDDLPDAIAAAREHDPKVIVEAGIVGREVECGVLEFPNGDVLASVVAEIRMIGADEETGAFYDFDSKYLDDVVGFDIPAKLDDAVSDELRDLAVRAFRAVDCQGLARIDFFVTEDGPVINEINTMPGFTSISMYPRMWEATGVDYPTLVSTLVETALARGTGLR
jgi:D-alanine-D-alanine ligase